ncbi:hypothetical protein [Roseinatronobacter monicus]|uniref:Uncharacterized protein n=1 Tax=Roseinatronobacter monicus TaxID=393481 RepID=A0A543K3I2_9RHOB|nr:hypothetical protein [Roseinatronobacter monicus]TQM89594.1 hypothetical protein BD293_4618 [Roseinatronobacter monicus]
MNKKQTAKLTHDIYELKEGLINRQIGILYQWNTGETEMRWLIPPTSFEGGHIMKVPIVACGAKATQAAGAA